MNFFDVLEILIERFGVSGLAAALAVGVFLWLRIFRHTIRSIIDPLGYVLTMSSFTVTLLTLMTIVGIVEIEKTAFVVLTLILFYGSFINTSTRRGAPVQKIYVNRLGFTKSRIVLSNRKQCATENVAVQFEPLSSTKLSAFFWLSIILQLAVYYRFGIPILQESRLTSFAGGGGAGILPRFADGTNQVCLIVAFIAFKTNRKKTMPWVIALVTQASIGAILSGAKGAVLSLAFAWYLSEVFSSKRWTVWRNPSKRGYAALALIVAAPLLVAHLSIRDVAGSVGLLSTIAVRLVAEGDGYAYFLGHNFIDQIARFDPLALVRPLLATLRITANDATVTPGFVVVTELLGIPDPTWGPNARLPVFILFFYGWPGIILAPVLGMTLGALRNATLRATLLHPVRYAVTASCYASVCRLEVDPQIALNGLINIALAMPLIWLAGSSSVARRRTTKISNVDHLAVRDHFGAA